MAQRAYQAFFKKRLQTQSFLDTQMSTSYMTDLTSKIISSLKSANVQGKKKRQKAEMVKSRIKSKQNQQNQQREQLRTNIDSRMRISQTNLQKISSQRKKVLSSRSQLQQTRRKKFKQEQKKKLEKSLVQMHKYQQQAQKFFRDTQSKKLQQFRRQQSISKSDKTRYDSFNNTISKDTIRDNDWAKNSRSSSNHQSVKPSFNVLKVSQEQILHKQQKKKQIQVEKQCKYLSDYVAKMQDIVNVRKKAVKQIKQPKATLPKVISNQRKVAPRKSFSIQSHKFSSDKNARKKVSFSEMYMQKLTQKKQKKQLYHSIALQQGDQILERQYQKTKLLKQSKIIKQSLNQYRRWSNMITRYKNND